MSKISIIVPVFNAENYISNCIESLLNQTYKDIEILLINDGSTDKSLQICEIYAKRDERIRLHSINNSGVSTARNLGISLSTGEYITFVDSDDWAESNMLEFAITKIKETKSDIVIWSCFKNYSNNELKISMIPGGDKTFFEDKDILFLKSIHAMFGEKRVGDSVSTGSVWCKLYQRELIINNKIYFNPDLIRAQDTIFSIQAFQHANKISYFDEKLYHYRINNSSTTSGTRFIANSTVPFNALLKEFQLFLNKNHKYKDERFRSAFYARSVQVLKWHLEHNYFHENYSHGLKNRRRDIIKLIQSEPYKEAISKVNVSILPKKEKVMAIFFRYKLILAFYVLFKLNGRLESLRKRKFD